MGSHILSSESREYPEDQHHEISADPFPRYCGHLWSCSPRHHKRHNYNHYPYYHYHFHHHHHNHRVFYHYDHGCLHFHDNRFYYHHDNGSNNHHNNRRQQQLDYEGLIGGDDPQ